MSPQIEVKLNKGQKLAAWSWYLKHQIHVLNIIDSVRYGYPPTDAEDLGNPALWKPAHWVWFFAVCRTEEQS